MNSSLDIDINLVRDNFTLGLCESILLKEITAIFGASGSGKTSLLRSVAGLESSVSGSIRFRDRTWLDRDTCLATEKRRVGYVFPDGRLFAHLDVRGNLQFAMRQASVPAIMSLDETVAVLGLEDLLGRDTRSLSNGERQRVAIARSLLAAPDLLLMDEPLSSLDRARKAELLPLIRSLPGKFGLPVVYVTHDIDELLRLADSVVLMADGRCHARGAPRDVIRSRDFRELADIDDDFCLLDATVSAQEDKLTITSIGGQTLKIPAITSRPGDRIRLLVRPEDVILATSKPTGISIRNCLSGQLQDLQLTDNGQCTARLDIAGQQLCALVTEDAVRELGLGIGEPIHALIKTVAITAFNSLDQKP